MFGYSEQRVPPHAQEVVMRHIAFTLALHTDTLLLYAPAGEFGKTNIKGSVGRSKKWTS